MTSPSWKTGAKQTIAFFDTEKEPITFSILVDSSSSMNSGDKEEAAQDVLGRLVQDSRLEDELNVMQFTDRIASYRQLTHDEKLLASGPELTSSSGGTALYDAIASSLCHLRTAKNLRQALVVITDGADQHSRLSLEQLIRLVQSGSAQLFMIGFYAGSERSFYEQGDAKVTLVTGHDIDNPMRVFQRLAKESGAEFFFPTSKKELLQAEETISNILKAQYTLAYYTQNTTQNYRRIQVKLNRGGAKIRVREGVASKSVADSAVHFSDACEVAPEDHRYPYEPRVSKDGANLVYQEDFSDPRSGWPNREFSRYTPKGYELSYTDETQKGDKLLINSGPMGRGTLVAYGPWWQDTRASVEVDAGWSKMAAPNPLRKPSARSEELYASSAGLAFRVNNEGFYAFLVSTTAKSYESSQLAFELIKKGFGGREEKIVPWTSVASLNIKQRFTAGSKLTVECVGNQITLFMDDQQVAAVHDTAYSHGYVGLVLYGAGHVLLRNLAVEGDS
ncbi:MAG TPA: VWA domain-containing protein [Candidatus Acidoferrum sp.]|nr:VWA domain-containing protein [Candidatus Acidoferrum sp.]